MITKEKIKNFYKEHKKEILLGGGSIVIGYIGGRKLKKALQSDIFETMTEVQQKRLMAEWLKGNIADWCLVMKTDVITDRPDYWVFRSSKEFMDEVLKFK